MKRFAEPTVIIGDVVASRTSPHRAALHDRLHAVLEATNAGFGCDLRITVGDEYQGTVASLGTATAVALQLRLALLPEHDVRHGIGRGETVRLDESAAIEDGPGWWAAREAIDAVRAAATRPATRAARTDVRDAGRPAGDGAVRAALLARDELVGRLDDRSLSVLRALMADRSQREAAVEVGISPSAVSQRVRSDALGVVVQMSRWLATVE